MKKFFFVLIWSSLFVANMHAQNDEILLSIGDVDVSKTEFEHFYRKNNQNLQNDAEVKTPEEYLELFIDYKLKVIEAMELQMDTTAAFQNELAGYRKELAAPYLTDMKYDEALIQELYNRMTREVSASHILLRTDPNDPQTKEKEVLKKIREVRNEILDGKPFSEAAKAYSEDQGGRENGGRLGYFTAFQMVAPFENAAFNTPPGQISEPVRTSFGYHLIKVHDIRKNQGEIKVAHIMKMFPQNNPGFDKKIIREAIDSIYTELLKGADFAAMAQKHSEDKRSGLNGGEMPWFSAGRMIPSFSQAAFAIQEKGDISPPIETPFGFHIIKKIDHRPVPDFDEARPKIEERIKKDPARSLSGQKELVKKLKQEYHFTQNPQNLKEFSHAGQKGKISPNQILFTIDNRNFTVTDFSGYLKKNKIPDKDYSSSFEDWVHEEIIALENEKLEEKYPEFKYLMREYHDGILLFNIMEEKIWQFASRDSAGLEKYYSKNKGKYVWGERFRGVIVTCESPAVKQQAENDLEAGMTPAEIKSEFQKENIDITLEEGAWEAGSNPAVDYFIWEKKKSGDFQHDNTLVHGKIIPPGPKTLDEARGLYISDYQKYLEEKWLKDLRRKYKIKINKKILKSISHV